MYIMKGIKELKNHLHITNDSGYMHNYYNNFVYLHIYTPTTNLGNLWAKMWTFYNFLYYNLTDVNALKLHINYDLKLHVPSR